MVLTLYGHKDLWPQFLFSRNGENSDRPHWLFHWPKLPLPAQPPSKCTMGFLPHKNVLSSAFITTPDIKLFPTKEFWQTVISLANALSWPLCMFFCQKKDKLNEAAFTVDADYKSNGLHMVNCDQRMLIRHSRPRFFIPPSCYFLTQNNVLRKEHRMRDWAIARFICNPFTKCLDDHIQLGWFWKCPKDRRCRRKCQITGIDRLIGWKNTSSNTWYSCILRHILASNWSFGRPANDPEFRENIGKLCHKKVVWITWQIPLLLQIKSLLA